jgi:hypothetical protein
MLVKWSGLGMAKYKLFSIFILVLLGGCAEKPLEPIITQEVSFYDSGEKPRELMTGNTKVGLLTILIDYCWNEDQSICETKIENPAKNLEGIKTQLMEKGELVSFHFDANPLLKAPLPTSAKLYQFKDDTITEVTINLDNKFNLPTESGRYNYGYFATFEGDIKGEAFYGFAVIVK